MLVTDTQRSEVHPAIGLLRFMPAKRKGGQEYGQHYANEKPPPMNLCLILVYQDQ